jgi:hypothetical protein
MSKPLHMTQPSDDQLPRSTRDPLSPGRNDLNPSDEPGIDELLGNDGPEPLGDSPTPYEKGVPDMDPANAEIDDQPNPQ